jgi:hypothetical protein
MSFCCPKEIKLEDGAIIAEEEEEEGDSLKMRIWVRNFV